MKIAVYTIAKNEEGFVKRWAESCKEADYRIICDTGSTDNTVSLAQSIGVTVHQKVFSPWRFDTSRNWSIDCIPEDVDFAICLDMDEVMVPGWREALEATPNINSYNRLRYKYVWSWKENGEEGLVYASDKIHCPKSFYWKHPVHEVLCAKEGFAEKVGWIENLQIHHHPDQTKPRSQYLPLLELAVEEDPLNDRNLYYLGREYYFYKRYSEAAVYLKRYLTIATWKPERAAATRLLSIVEPESKESWLWKALAEDSGRRENWVELAKHFYFKQDWESCRWASLKAISISDKPLDYLCNAEAWGEAAFDFAAIACYNLGQYDEAYRYGKIAADKAPQEQRLKDNLKFFEQKVSSNA